MQNLEPLTLKSRFFYCGGLSSSSLIGQANYILLPGPSHPRQTSPIPYLRTIAEYLQPFVEMSSPQHCRFAIPIQFHGTCRAVIKRLYICRPPPPRHGGKEDDRRSRVPSVGGGNKRSVCPPDLMCTFVN